MGHIGEHVTLDDPAYIHESAWLYGKVYVGPGASIWPNVVTRAETFEIRIGARTNIQDFVMIHVGIASPTIIGEDCSITHHATLHGCEIGDRCLIGINATIMDGAKISHFIAKTTPHLARKKWISGMLTPNGRIFIDQGAKIALIAGKSLLPAGITSAEGNFERGDAVVICDDDSNEIARGLSAYSISDTLDIKGKSTLEIENILGYRGRSALVHRDDLVIADTGD